MNRELEQSQKDFFSDQGFLVLPGIFDIGAIQEVQQLLDPLFQDSCKLIESALYRDGEQREKAHPRSAEVYRAVRMEPRLARTTVYRTCQTLAKQLLGWNSAYSYDHAIYKRPYSDGETPWHQDQAYMGHAVSLNTANFWIPLQDVTELNGCMQFVPRSHRRGLLPHRRLNLDSHAQILGVAEIEHTKSVPCPLLVGGITVHTPLTLHYTSPNITDDVRRAWSVHFGPFGQLAKLHPRIVLKFIYDRSLPRPSF